MTEAETTRLAASGAVAGLCPTTEANLGDGLFPAVDFLRAGGTFGIGSDSHISISPIEELRWLEYGQRLAYQARNLLAKGAGASLGANLYREALKGGARALGRRTGHLQEGARADLLVLDQESAILAGKSGDAVLDAFVFSGNVNTVRHVMVGARWLIRDGHHAKEEEIGSRYRQCLERLTA